MSIKIDAAWDANRKLYGARKIWHVLRRQGEDAARCTVERLMLRLGIRGVVRGRRVITTNPDTSQPCPDDKVNRLFIADRPNRLCPLGVCFAKARRVTGFRLHLRAHMVGNSLCGVRYRRLRTPYRWLACLDIDEDPVRARRVGSGDLPKKDADNKSLVHHSDRGSQYLSIKYTERLAEAEIDLSVGTVGDAYDNALAECVIGLFKTEVINQIGPWKSLREVEWETLKWVDWYNNHRLLGPIGYSPPAEAEEAFYANLNTLDMVA